jgi:Rod binding domain-containing protein
MTAPLATLPLGASLLPEGQVGQLKRLRETAQDFEALFVAQMLATMNQGLSHGLAGPSGQSDVYQDMFNQEVGKLISRAGGIGVADAILREMLKMQELA